MDAMDRSFIDTPSARLALFAEREKRVDRQIRSAAQTALALAGAVGRVGMFEAAALPIAIKAVDQIPGGVGAALVPAGAAIPNRLRPVAARERQNFGRRR